MRRFCAALGILAVTASVATVSGSAPAAGDALTFVVGGFPPDAGVLRLHLGTDADYFRYDPSNGSGGYTAGAPNHLVVSGCNLPTPLSLTGAGVALTPGPSGGPQQGKLGLIDDDIGVQVKGEGNGTSCGQANGAGQSLTIELAGTLSSKEIDFAELDVEGKFGVKVKAQMFSGPTLVATEYRTTGGPDSGPDSSDGDNFRWRLPAAGTLLFDKVKLSVDESTPGGAFSLAGGADGTLPLGGGLADLKLADTTDTIFHITDVDALACGGTATTGGGASPHASVTLAAAGCTGPIPYSLQTGTDGAGNQAILFQKDAEATSTFFATFTWTVEESAYPVPPTKIDFGAGAADLTWCDGTYAAPVRPAADVPWCLRKHTAALAGDGLMQVVEELFGVGDPFTFR